MPLPIHQDKVEKKRKREKRKERKKESTGMLQLII